MRDAYYVFDRHPRLQLVIGHMGEMLPFMLARVDDNLPPAVSGPDRLPTSTASRTPMPSACWAA